MEDCSDRRFREEGTQLAADKGNCGSSLQNPAEDNAQHCGKRVNHGWTCFFCGFLNLNRYEICERCSRPRIMRGN